MRVYEAIIFDLDGVICSTDAYHYQAWKQLADSLGIPFDHQTNNRLRGVSRMESLEIILEAHQGKTFSDVQKMQFAEEKNDNYKKLLAQVGSNDLSDEVKETLDCLRGMGLQLAIGSSSKNAPQILRQLGLENYFDAIADGNQISKSKPDPEVFLLAARKLGIAPQKCLVVEDAVSGAEAGFAGGFRVACVGDASARGAGNYNLRAFSELKNIMEQETMV